MNEYNFFTIAEIILIIGLSDKHINTSNTSEGKIPKIGKLKQLSNILNTKDEKPLLYAKC